MADRAIIALVPRAPTKLAYEVEAIERFLVFLGESRGKTYKIIDENVVVDLTTGRNYDYQLALDGTTTPAVAVEIFRLVEDEADLASARTRGLLWEAIKTAFASHGISGVLVVTPDVVILPPREHASYANALARAARQSLTENPRAAEIRLDGGIELNRLKGLGAVACSSHSQARWIDGVGIATPPLMKHLAKKDSQLAVEGLERIILCINWAWAVDPDDAVKAIALMDVSELKHTDLVYFESGGRHKLIYARCVREAVSGFAPAPQGQGVGTLFETITRSSRRKGQPRSAGVSSPTFRLWRNRLGFETAT